MKRLAALLPLLAGCSAPPEAGGGGDVRIECALAGESAFARTCTLDRGSGGLLTVRGPSGTFRRFRVAPGGELSAADGAEPASVTPLPGGLVEVAVGSDRYRLPAAAP